MAATDTTDRHELRIEGLRAKVAGREILQGIDLVIRGGEVHAVMGPNGSGKSTLSHVLMGKPGYEVTGGRVTLDGQDLLGLPTWERAQAGLFLALQYPVEVPGVSLIDVLRESLVAAGEVDVEGPVEEPLVEADASRFDEHALAHLIAGTTRCRERLVENLLEGHARHLGGVLHGEEEPGARALPGRERQQIDTVEGDGAAEHLVAGAAGDDV